MTWAAVVTIGGNLYGASQNREAASRASDAATRANENSMAFQREMFDKQLGLTAPYREGGTTAQNKLMELLGIGTNTGGAEYGKYARDFGMSDFVTDPGYLFRLTEGQKAIDRSAAARGGTQSGAALKAATRYGQEAGSQEYGNAYERYNTNRTNRLAPLGSIATMGANAATNSATATGDYGARGGRLLSDTGETQANALWAAQQSNNSAYGDIGKTIGGMDFSKINLLPTREWG
jgi:hypothetical protein